MSWQHCSLNWPPSAASIQQQAESTTAQVAHEAMAATERINALASDANYGRHTLSQDAEALLTLRGELNMLMQQGQVLTVHPYQFQVGDRLSAGCFLNPKNATATLAEKLKDSTDANRPSQSINAIAIMLTVNQLTEFAAQLEQITSVFTLPEWCHVARQAKSEAASATAKMHQPAAITQPRFKPVATLNANPARDYHYWQSAQISTLESLAADKTTVIQKLNALASKRAVYLQEVSQNINALKALSGSVYSAQFAGSANSIATQIEKLSPPNNHQHTIVSLLISTQPLTFWEGLLCH